MIDGHALDLRQKVGDVTSLSAAEAVAEVHAASFRLGVELSRRTDASCKARSLSAAVSFRSAPSLMV